jgi:hypothetical protein
MYAVPGQELAGFTEAESRRYDEMHGRYFEIGKSRLVRVVPVGQAIDAEGVLIELTAIEMRDLGAVLLWRTVTGDDRILGPPEVSIGDDAGTEYEINWGSWSGSDHESRGETRFGPSPPAEAATLFVEIKSFGGNAGTPLPDHVPVPWHGVEGPWSFEVSLRA